MSSKKDHLASWDKFLKTNEEESKRIREQYERLRSSLKGSQNRFYSSLWFIIRKKL